MEPLKTTVAFLLFLVVLHSSAAQSVKDQKEVHPQNVAEPKPDHHEEPKDDKKTEKIPVEAAEQLHENQPKSQPEKQHESQPEHKPEPQQEMQPEHKPESAHVSEEQSQDPQVLQHGYVTGRQFPQMYQPMFPPPSGFNMIRRQLGGGMEILGDIVMMSMIGLPILGLLTVGSSSIANFLGFGSSSSSKSSSKRNRRSLKEKAAGAVEYAKTLWDVMEQLERAFEKYDLYQAECRLRAVCEAHHKVPRLGAWAQTILDLMRKQKELQSREILPVSRFLFSNYADAAQAGTRGDDCAQLYTGCPHHLSYYFSAKENEVENEIEVEM
ncbi:uncharacterized protein LOC118182743 [Stegodyphus dumicola]|uniref:uncharacterized protein LOC118182743 n=1 Tax=Stegodyphus dumicola TaxID=202533 RepID=UPI0015ACA4F2|nr:uncharacterized protein LOC118182743 [Stegodyphus dumicola]